MRRIAILLILMFLPVMPSAQAAGGGNLYGKVIILDPGHGLETTNVYAGYDEQAAMFKLACKIKPLLEARGATVHMTRTTQHDVSLYVRAAMINRLALQAVKDSRQRMLLASPADSDTIKKELQELDRLLRVMRSIEENPEKNAAVYLNTPYSSKRKIHPDLKKVFEYESDPEVYNRFLVISLHSNATARPINTKAQGADMFVAACSGYFSDYANYKRSSYFGELLLNGISGLGIRKNKVNSSNLFMVREHNVPGVLAENGFHTNSGDRAKLSSDVFLDKLATAYADAISEYFN